MRSMPGLGCWLWLCAAGLAGAAPLDDVRELRADGRLHQALGRLEQRLGGLDAAAREQAEAERIALLIDLARYAEADHALQQRLPASQGLQRAQLLFEAARLALQRDDRQAAAQGFAASAEAAGQQSSLGQRAQLQALGLRPAAERAPGLAALADALDEPALQLQLAALALPADPVLAERLLRRVQQAARATPRERLQAGDQLAALHEAAGQRERALALTRQTLQALDALPAAQQGDLRVHLEWRAARLQQGPAALAALLRASHQLALLRIDWPLRGADGRSSYEALFEPLYEQLLTGLLGAARSASGDAQRQHLLRQARDAVEQLRQAELQDYLGDRCEVDAIKGDDPGGLPPRSAVIYPLLLAERVSLLVEDERGLALFDSPASAAALRRAALHLAQQLRERGPDYLAAAQALHDGLLAPLQNWLDAAGHQTLVWVNAGELRLAPMAALHDGSRFAVERYASVAAQGISMTNTESGAAVSRRGGHLLAGAARFGGVVERLADEVWAAPLRRQLLGAAAEGGTRSVQQARLRDALELPGVGDELQRLAPLLPGAQLRDAGFTVARFGKQVQQGGHRVVHIASHGVFGGSAADSYLLAYDDLLTLDALQGLLQSDAARRQPIELLTLSACQTAEGNSRAPMGIAGAALKARARAVLGTLWPVDDQATVGLMQAFYASWQQQGGKGEALRAAQLGLLADSETRHPYYWAPFALIGNWR